MTTTKRYRVIAKTDTNDFKKWNVNDLIRFTAFLDKHYSEWRYFNVFEYITGDLKGGKQLGNFTNKDRPKKRFI